METCLAKTGNEEEKWNSQVRKTCFVPVPSVRCALLPEPSVITQSHGTRPQHTKPEHFPICCSALDRMFLIPYVLILLRWQRHMWKGSLLQHDSSSFFWLLVRASSRAASKVFVQWSEPHFHSCESQRYLGTGKGHYKVRPRPIFILSHKPPSSLFYFAPTLIWWHPTLNRWDSEINISESV